VHFTAVSTEHDLEPGSPQRAWLERELASVDRCRTPWLVLLLHRPMYGAPRPGRAGPGGARGCREAGRCF
jgi:hypothetical protein